MKKLFPLLILIISFSASGCLRSYWCDKPEQCNEIVQVIDLTGLDGCGYVLERKDGTRLEPINLGDFGIEIKDSMWVEMSYQEKKGFASICMVGPIVELNCLTEVNKTNTVDK